MGGKQKAAATGQQVARARRVAVAARKVERVPPDAVPDVHQLFHALGGFPLLAPPLDQRALGRQRLRELLGFRVPAVEVARDRAARRGRARLRGAAVHAARAAGPLHGAVVVVLLVARPAFAFFLAERGLVQVRPGHVLDEQLDDLAAPGARGLVQRRGAVLLVRRAQVGAERFQQQRAALHVAVGRGLEQQQRGVDGGHGGLAGEPEVRAPRDEQQARQPVVRVLELPFRRQLLHERQLLLVEQADARLLREDLAVLLADVGLVVDGLLLPALGAGAPGEPVRRGSTGNATSLVRHHPSWSQVCDRK